MSNLFHTISPNTPDEVKTYNFISNNYFSGVPTGRLADANGTPGNFTNTYLGDWIINQAFTSTTAIRSSTTYAFYFPSIANTPTANETLTGQVSTTARRFSFSMANSPGPINNSTLTSNISTLTNGGATNQTSASLSTGGTNTMGTTNNNYFNFGACSNSTLAMAGFITPTITGGDLLTVATNSCIVIFGWMHSHIYPTNATLNQWARFNPCFNLSLASTISSGVSTINGGAPTTLNNSTTRNFVIGYRDLVCSSGSYNPGQITLADIVLFYFNTPYRVPIGTVDNRVACMGRGLLQVGRVYRINNCFGRTGFEDWLCVAPLVPSTYSFVDWIPGTDSLYAGAWSINEEDYILIRIWTEAD